MNFTYALPVVKGDPNIYASFDGKVNVTAIGGSSKGIRIQLAVAPGSSQAQLYTTMRCMIGFKKDAANPAIGTIHMKTVLEDIKKLIPQKLSDDAANLQPPNFPAGMPLPGEFLYKNVDTNAFETDLRAYLLANPRPEDILLLAWPIEPESHVLSNPLTDNDRAQMREHFIKMVMKNRVVPWVVGGMPFGKAAADPAVPGSTMFMYEWLDLDASSPGQLSPIPYIQSLPVAVDEDKWETHPLVVATTGFPIPLDIHLKFESFNPTLPLGPNNYIPIAGFQVEMWNFNPVPFTNELIATRTTDPNGKVTFSVANVKTMASEPEPDIFFIVKVGGHPLPWDASKNFPSDWSTEYLSALNGAPGYFNDFAGSRLGTVANPLVFRVGFDYHIKCIYRKDRQASITIGAPIGVRVELWARPKSMPDKKIADKKTDKNGEIHGMVFRDLDDGYNLRGDELLFIRIPMEMEDSSINMPLSIVGEWIWFVNDWIAAPLVLSSLFVETTLKDRAAYSSLGEPAKPFEFEPVDNYSIYHGGFYVLKVYREFCQAMHLLTSYNDGTKNYVWEGNDIALNLDPDSQLDHAYVKNGDHVRLQGAEIWNRETIFHELGHVIMASATDVYDDDTWDHPGAHYFAMFTNPHFALSEGWAAFIGHLGDTYYSGHPENYENAYSGPPDAPVQLYTLRKKPFNKGESVEGLFAQSLYQIFRNFVAGTSTGTVSIMESDYGDVLQPFANSWLQLPVTAQRFVQYIWKPFIALNSSNPSVSFMTTTEYIEQMKLANPTEWHKLQPWFMAYDLGRIPVTMTSLSTNTGSVGVSTRITINGTNFIDIISVSYSSNEEVTGKFIMNDTDAAGMLIEFVDYTSTPGTAQRYPAKNVVVKNSGAQVDCDTPVLASPAVLKVEATLFVMGEFAYRTLGPQPGGLTFTVV